MSKKIKKKLKKVQKGYRMLFFLKKTGKTGEKGVWDCGLKWKRV